MVYLSKKDSNIVIRELSKSSNKNTKKIINKIKNPVKLVYIREFPEIKKLLRKSFNEERMVKIRYYSPHSEEHSSRIIDIYQIHKGCITAYCHLRGGERVFRTDRISSVAILEEKYSIPKGWKSENIILN